jgi:hypothetical protein
MGGSTKLRPGFLWDPDRRVVVAERLGVAFEDRDSNPRRDDGVKGVFDRLQGAEALQRFKVDRVSSAGDDLIEPTRDSPQFVANARESLPRRGALPAASMPDKATMPPYA